MAMKLFVRLALFAAVLGAAADALAQREMTREEYIATYAPLAIQQQKEYGIPASIKIAQGIIESRYGNSDLSRRSNNHFGITGYGASNAFWHGGRVTARYKRGELLFRRYDSARNSYLDFARLLVCSYPQAAAMSRFPADYAKAIAYSPYISELNGDNRERYRETLVQLCHEIEPIYSSLKNNN